MAVHKAAQLRPQASNDYAEEPTTLSLPAEPATETVRTEEMQPLAAPATLDADPSVAKLGVPVPPSEGDRRHSAPEWAAATELARYAEEGKMNDVRVILHHAGMTVAITEIPLIVDSCRAVGLNDAADTFLHFVGLRPVEEVLRIVRYLLSLKRYTDADAVAQTAVPAA
ncbi:hypothetical protein OG589_40585 [Sphaerisporangium sp. NBC_01403]|uniref:hypothetical protein n=1 Tax=Sphaerisporangium sp. NBC_01403 TaxID=2903599 RepID=UPI0032508E3D